jgi:hypothetical protein
MNDEANEAFENYMRRIYETPNLSKLPTKSGGVWYFDEYTDTSWCAWEEAWSMCSAQKKGP